MTKSALVLLVLAGFGCATPPAPEAGRDAATTAQAVQAVPKPPAAAAQAPSKVGAPVKVEATLGEAAARVEITFLSAGRDVSVELRGTEGLAILGDPLPIQGGSFAAGQTVALDVAFAPGEAHSNLAVLVDGEFAGGRRSRAASFTVGEPGKVRATSTTVVDAQGTRIKISGQAKEK
jgi:hypothetical protein